MSTHHHRSTLKQKNKPFKSKHATKGSIKEQAKGRVPQYHAASGVAGAGVVKRADPRIPPVVSQAQSKINRRNQAKQVQRAKRQSLVEATRLFNGVDGAPRIVAVIPLCEDVSAKDLVVKLLKGLGEEAESIGADCPERGIWRARAERFRTSLQFILLPYGHLYSTLDAAKGADYVILGLSASTEVDSWGDMLLRSLQAQGFPQAIAAIPTPHDDTLMEEKSRKSTLKTTQSILKSLLSFTQYFVPSLTRVFDLSTSADASTALRSLCEGRPTDVRWRMGRGYLVSEALSFEPDTSSTSDMSTGSKGLLKVTGVVRGAPISANRLIHIPGWGDFQLKRIVESPRAPRGAQGDGTMDVEAKVLSEPSTGDTADEERDDLVSVNEVDDMQNEQTWPTEEEMRDDGSAVGAGERLPDAAEGTTPKVVKRVPKGTSAYQAAWLLEDEEVDEEEDVSEPDEQGEDDMSEATAKADEEEEEYENVAEDKTSRSVAFEDMDMEEEKRQLASWRARQKEHSTHLAFPDEIDTPMDVPARQRFARYRGLKSFRTSPWDPNENLPRDYAKIFRVGEKEWESVSRKIMQGDIGEGVEPGTRVTLEIQNVPEAFMDAYDPTTPLIVHALHRHEHKKTVLNFTLQRNSEYTEPVRSKDSLILCVGSRRLAVNPLFSQHLRGGAKSSNNVHKFERFLREGVASVGTIYGPLTFGRLPVTLLKETDDPQAPILVASGTLLPPSTTRIVAKRILLTGHPIKIHKRSVTVRYMFFNPADVAYFKPVQLSSKYGRTGHIMESLGTHGYFKAHFDGNMTQMDTVCLALYKRVYPKWATEWSAKGKEAGGDGMEE